MKDTRVEQKDVDKDEERKEVAKEEDKEEEEEEEEEEDLEEDKEDEKDKGLDLDNRLKDLSPKRSACPKILALNFFFYLYQN